MGEKASDVLAQAGLDDPRGITILGVVIVVFGLLAMMAPLVAGVTVALLVGFLLIAAGVVRFIFALRCRSGGRKRMLPLVVGALTTLAGLLVIIHPLVALASLTLLIAIYFMVDGIGEILGALETRPLAGWGWLLFGGIVSVLLGLMIWNQWPLSGAWAIGILVGIKLLVVGWAIVCLGMAARAGDPAGTRA